jgi:hypothetical protein
VKSGFVSLGLALLVEALLARPADVLPALPNAALQLGAIHLLTVGWLLQLISGVAFWMFPRHPTVPPRGDERLGWAALWFLNTGLGLRLLGEAWRLGWGGPSWPLIIAAILQLVAVALVVTLIWPRVRELRS